MKGFIVLIFAVFISAFIGMWMEGLGTLEPKWFWALGIIYGFAGMRIALWVEE